MKNIRKMLGEAKDVLDALNIEYGIIANVTVNTRAKRRWGQCSYKGNNCYAIEISDKLLQDEVSWESAMNTMIHELLHAHKDRMCHTGEWKRCANLVNRFYPQYNIKRCTSSEEKGLAPSISTNKYKYAIKCDDCGHTCYYTKKSKVVKLIMARPKNSSCYCGKCKKSNFTVKVLDN